MVGVFVFRVCAHYWTGVCVNRGALACASHAKACTECGKDLCSNCVVSKGILSANILPINEEEDKPNHRDNNGEEGFPTGFPRSKLQGDRSQNSHRTMLPSCEGLSIGSAGNLGGRPATTVRTHTDGLTVQFPLPGLALCMVLTPGGTNLVLNVNSEPLNCDGSARG
jgi:hypothetical protein